MSTVTITAARAEELAGAANILAEAFEHDPVLGAIIPGERNRRARLAQLFHGTLASGAFATGTVDLARDETGTLLGVAAWEGPQSQRGAFLRQVRELPRFLSSLGWRGLPRALRLLGQLEKHRPRSAHWYLAEIGVSAAARGKGVGKQLLETQLTALDRMRQSAYLESSTPANRRLYQRLGFQELRPIHGLPGAQPVAMLRAAHA